MEQPKPTEQHRKLERLVGSWVGEEEISGSPHTTETKASGTFDFRMDLGDLFAIVDYVEQSGGNTLMAGHGVIGWNPKEKGYTLHWFDTFGSPPSVPSKGQWLGDALKFEQQGSGNTIFELRDGSLIFKIEMDVAGKGMRPVIVGKYRRADADAEATRRVSLNRIV